jgi:dTDP-6-deoxy-L-talose 4-dehydrogenase (NAD+)
MNVAVTGASGFLGKHVVHDLLLRGIRPTILIRQNSEVPEGFCELPLARFDISNSPDDAFDQLGKPDTLIHLAWNGLPNYQSLHHFDSELPAQYRFLSAVAQQGLSHLIVTGTCFEYGMQSGCLLETDETNPANPYGFAKDALRRQLQFLAETVDFDLTWARLFYLYGEGQAASSLYSQLFAAASRGEKTFDMSGGEQLRDYLPVKEAVRCFIDLALGRSRPGAVNICSGRPVSVRRLVEEWIAENHFQMELNLGAFAYSDYEPMAFWGSRRKLDESLQQNETGSGSTYFDMAQPGCVK